MGLRIEDAIQRIEKYLRRNDSHPRLVNVNNKDDRKAICREFSPCGYIFKSVLDFSPKDENLSEESLYNFLENAQGDVFLLGFASYYRLLGEKKLEDFLHQIMGMSLSGMHLVVLCYQCEKYLEKMDQRYSSFVYLVDGEKQAFPQLNFVAKDIPIKEGEDVVKGIQDITAYIEQKSSSELFVQTQKSKASFPFSLYSIKEFKNPFDVLCDMDVSTRQLKEEYGTKQDWHRALEKIARYGSWMKYIVEVFGSATNLENIIGGWTTFDPEKKWLYFIALKLYGTKNSWCLQEAAKYAEKSEQLIRGVFRSLLCLSHEDKDFWKHYKERKALIKALGNPDVEVADYCFMVRSRGENALYYLTDASEREKTLIFENLAASSEEIGRSKVLEILEHVYPDLYSYLQPFHCKIPLLDSYFQEYKYQKVVNKLFPEFLQIVNEQAEKREFNLLLPARSEKIDAIKKTGTGVYFMDAMGVEYLSFIMEQCHSKGLIADVILCRCELPSITKCNKEFVEAFEEGGAKFALGKNGNKKLDLLKHHSDEGFDYTNNKLPTYLSKELEIIRSVMENIATNLQNGAYKRAVMLSDHGASRLSVLNEKENKWGSDSNAEHSGRCCPVNEVDGKPSCAIEENGYWVLANYDRFKGGRKANVEVHGGATLEEVVVPIIEIVYPPEEIEILLLDKKITFSRRKKNAAIRVFSKTKLDSLSVQISGLDGEYDGVSSDGHTFTIALPELRKSGKYTATVYYDHNQLKSQLIFLAENSGFSEREIL